MVDGFDVVAVRIEDEGGIVARMIAAFPGSSVVAPARGDGCCIERIDRGSAARLEGEVGSAAYLVAPAVRPSMNFRWKIR